MGEMTFIVYLSIPVLTFGFGYFWITNRRHNKLFNQFELFRSETYRIKNMTELKELEDRVMLWGNKLRLESEVPWRRELFGLMRDRRDYLKEFENEK